MSPHRHRRTISPARTSSRSPALTSASAPERSRRPRTGWHSLARVPADGSTRAAPGSGQSPRGRRRRRPSSRSPRRPVPRPAAMRRSSTGQRSDRPRRRPEREPGPCRQARPPAPAPSHPPRSTRPVWRTREPGRGTAQEAEPGHREQQRVCQPGGLHGISSPTARHWSIDCRAGASRRCGGREVEAGAQAAAIELVSSSRGTVRRDRTRWRSRGRRRPCLVDAPPALQDLLPIRLGDSRAVVLDGEPQGAASAATEANAERTACRDCPSGCRAFPRAPGIAMEHPSAPCPQR